MHPYRDRELARMAAMAAELDAKMSFPGLPVSSTPPNIWLPSDFGLIAWSGDPTNSAGNSIPTAGKLTGGAVLLRSAALVTNLILGVTTAGALTSGENFAGLYNSSFDLVASSADQTTNWETAGFQTMPISGGPVELQAGTYYLLALWNGTTGPTFANVGNNTIDLFALGTSPYRSLNIAGPYTALPASFATPGRNQTTMFGALS